MVGTHGGKKIVLEIGRGTDQNNSFLLVKWNSKSSLLAFCPTWQSAVIRHPDSSLSTHICSGGTWKRCCPGDISSPLENRWPREGGCGKPVSSWAVGAEGEHGSTLPSSRRSSERNLKLNEINSGLPGFPHPTQSPGPHVSPPGTFSLCPSEAGACFQPWAPPSQPNPWAHAPVQPQPILSKVPDARPGAAPVPQASLLLAGEMGQALSSPPRGVPTTPNAQPQGPTSPPSALTLEMCLGHHSGKRKAVIDPASRYPLNTEVFRTSKLNRVRTQAQYEHAL